jgi:hypothetical protein
LELGQLSVFGQLRLTGVTPGMGLAGLAHLDTPRTRKSKCHDDRASLIFAGKVFYILYMSHIKEIFVGRAVSFGFAGRGGLTLVSESRLLPSVL